MPFTLAEGGLLATGGFLVDAFTCSTHHSPGQLLLSRGTAESTQRGFHTKCSAPFHAQEPSTNPIQAFETLPIARTLWEAPAGCSLPQSILNSPSHQLSQEFLS